MLLFPTLYYTQKNICQWALKAGRRPEGASSKWERRNGKAAPSLIIEFLMCDLSFRMPCLSEAIQSRQPEMETKKWKWLKGTSFAFPTWNWRLGPVSGKPPSWMRGKEAVMPDWCKYLQLCHRPKCWPRRSGCPPPSAVLSLIDRGTCNCTYKGPNYSLGTLWGSVHI